MRPPGFFIGWQARIDAALARFLAGIAALLLAGFSGLGLLLGAAADDPAGRGFALAPGQVALPLPTETPLVGTLALHPYPLLRLAPDAAHPRGRTLLLAGGGKYGLAGIAALDGRLVEAEGYLLARGTIAMLATEAPPVPHAGTLPPPAAVEKLGRWRVTGEICDGKCAAGGMRPGIGLAHRACATLCLSGGVPAVFVPTAPVAGHPFLLLAGPDGAPMDPALRDRVALRVVLEGEVERLGDILVFRAEAATARTP